MKFTVKTTAGRVPLIAGVFADNNTQRLLESFQYYNLDGFSAIMSSSPAYVKPSQEGIFQHYMKLAEVSPLPIIIYNVPGRTASNVTAETVLRLANSSSKFFAVKEASGDMNQVQKILKYRPEGFLVLSGDDTITLPLIGCGGDGVISVIANALPHQYSSMVKNALDGNYPDAQRLNLMLQSIHPWLYVDGNPPGIKAALAIMGRCQNELRLPHVPVSSNTFDNIKSELQKIGMC
jgi:4-hydroxy-tetrahydrodipicolinate synthase